MAQTAHGMPLLSYQANDLVMVLARITNITGSVITVVINNPHSTDLANVQLTLHSTSGNTEGVFGKPLAVGDNLQLRAKVTSISGSGHGASVNLTVNHPGFSDSTAFTVAGGQVRGISHIQS